MFDRMIQIWKRGCEAQENVESAKREILGEIEGIKKTLRRQNLSLEAFREEILEGIGEKTLKEANPLLEIIESFFYFDTSLRDLPDFPISQIEAAELIWKKFDSLLSDFGLEIIRQPGSSFDPRLHESVEKPPETSG
jgi:molecular chaperone GrpE (heat shock protein)